MKRLFQFLTAAAVLTAGMHAAPIITLNPISGAVSGNPGSTVGWGFTITNNTTNFLVVTQTDFCDSGSVASNLPCSGQTDVHLLGSYTDFTVLSNFIDIGPSPGFLTQSFNPIAQTGFGSFTINSSATIGTVLAGEIAIVYELFNGDPANGGTQVGNDLFTSVPASITVRGAATAMPEPGTMLPIGLGLIAGALLLRRHVGKA